MPRDRLRTARNRRPAPDTGTARTPPTSTPTSTATATTKSIPLHGRPTSSASGRRLRLRRLLSQAYGASALHNTVHTATPPLPSPRSSGGSLTSPPWRQPRTSRLARETAPRRRRRRHHDRDRRVLRLSRDRRPPPPAVGHRGHRRGERLVRHDRRRRGLPAPRRRARRRGGRDRSPECDALPRPHALPRRRHPLGLPRRAVSSRGRRRARSRSAGPAACRPACRRLGEHHGRGGTAAGTSSSTPSGRRSRSRPSSPSPPGGPGPTTRSSRSTAAAPCRPRPDRLRNRPPRRRRERLLRLTPGHPLGFRGASALRRFRLPAPRLHSRPRNAHREGRSRGPGAGRFEGLSPSAAAGTSGCRRCRPWDCGR